jgi:MerR family copper efflux transcriptional regulator
MRISELSRRSGVPASTLRYYEDVGLLPATKRSPAGYRLYDDHARQRLMFIEAGKRLRLSLSSIGQLLPALDDRIAEADSAIADLQMLRDQLVVARKHVDDLPDRDQPCVPDCTFLGNDQALSCSLDGDQYRSRAEQWQQILQGGVRSLVPGGVQVTLPSERATELAALILAEQTCCSFLNFTLRLEGSTVVMMLTAPDPAQRIISDLTGGDGRGESSSMLSQGAHH